MEHDEYKYLNELIDQKMELNIEIIRLKNHITQMEIEDRINKRKIAALEKLISNLTKQLSEKGDKNE